MRDDFAHPLSKLAESGILIAAAPTGGKGFALTPDGKIPMSYVPILPFDRGGLSLQDFGTQYTGTVAGKDNQLRIIRADGAGYITNNAYFVPSSTGGSWHKDTTDVESLSCLIELGEGNLGFFIAPSGSTDPMAFVTALNAEYDGGTTGNIIVHVPNERLYVGKTRSEVTPATVDAELRVITRTGSVLPLYVRGNISYLSKMAGATASNTALSKISDGPDENNSAYIVTGIDQTGATVGHGFGGAFVSAGKNGTGSNFNLVLHTVGANDIIMAPNASEAWRVKNNGFYPGKEIDYAQATSPVTVSSSSEGSPTLIVSGSSKSYDGSQIVIAEFYCPYLTPVAGQNLVLNLWEDGVTNKGRLNASATTSDSGGTWKYRFTPSNGTHTYSIRAWNTSGTTGVVGAGAGGSGTYVPAFLRVTCI